MLNEENINEQSEKSSSTYLDDFYIPNPYPCINCDHDSQTESSIISNICLSDPTAGANSLSNTGTVNVVKIDSKPSSSISSNFALQDQISHRESSRNLSLEQSVRLNKGALVNKFFKKNESIINKIDNLSIIDKFYKNVQNPLDYSSHKSINLKAKSDKFLNEVSTKDSQVDFINYELRTKIAKHLLNSKVNASERKDVLKKNFWIDEDEPMARDETRLKRPSNSSVESDLLKSSNESKILMQQQPEIQSVANCVENDECSSNSVQFRFHENSTGDRMGDILKNYSSVSNDDPKENTTKAVKILMCHICGEMLRGRSSLKSHVHRHLGLKPHQCQYCFRAFTQSGSLRNHIRTHTDERPYSCIVCPESFKTQSTLVKHLTKHTVHRPFKCPKCHKCFKHKSYLSKHVKIHSDSFFCNICNTNFASKKSLATHTNKLHQRGEPHVCKFCQKKYSFKHQLLQHVVVHTGEIKCKCRVCGKGFLWKSSLAAHMQTHAFKIQCEICGDKFVSLKKLEKHRISHSNPVQHCCNQCPEKFKYLYLLKKHELQHKNGAGVLCDSCGRTFTSKIKLKRHHLKEHQLNVD